MPGPVSDSYDPEFGTGAAAHEVRTALETARTWLGKSIGSEPKDIVQVVRGDEGDDRHLVLSERDLRILRFSVSRALETL